MNWSFNHDRHFFSGVIELTPPQKKPLPKIFAIRFTSKAKCNSNNTSACSLIIQKCNLIKIICGSLRRLCPGISVWSTGAARRWHEQQQTDSNWRAGICICYQKYAISNSHDKDRPKEMKCLLPGSSAEHSRPLQHSVARRSIWQCWFWHWPTTVGNLSGRRGTSAPASAPCFDTPWTPEGWGCRNRDVSGDKWRQKFIGHSVVDYPQRYGWKEAKSDMTNGQVEAWQSGWSGRNERWGNEWEWGMVVRAAAWGWAEWQHMSGGQEFTGVANWREGAMTDWRAKKKRGRLRLIHPVKGGKICSPFLSVFLANF